MRELEHSSVSPLKLFDDARCMGNTSKEGGRPHCPPHPIFTASVREVEKPVPIFDLGDLFAKVGRAVDALLIRHLQPRLSIRQRFIGRKITALIKALTAAFCVPLRGSFSNTRNSDPRSARQGGDQPPPPAHFVIGT